MLRRPPAALLLPMLVPLLLASGCAQLQELIGRPTAHVAHATLQGLDLQGVNLAFDVVIVNPYAVALPLLRFDWEIAHDGDSVAKGSSFGATSIPAHGSSTLPMIAHVEFAPLLALGDDVQPGAVVDYVASLGLNVQAPSVGNLHVPLEYQGSFPIPTVPEVSLDAVHWSRLSLEEATAVLDIGIRNTNSFAMNLSHLAYDLKLGGTAVATGAVDQVLELAGGAPGNLKLKLAFRPADLGLAAFKMLTGSDATYDIGGRMTLGSAFGALDLPYSRKGKVLLGK